MALIAVAVNIYHDKPYDVYVGRENNNEWGNPFIVGVDGNRAECIAKYEEHIREKLMPQGVADRNFILRIARLHGKRLGCYCAPQRCHADVIAFYAAWAFKNKGKRNVRRLPAPRFNASGSLPSLWTIPSHD